jgi:hypothetical protein
MYRELKDLTPEYRKAIQTVIDGFKRKKHMKVTKVDLDGTGSPEGIVGKTSLPSALAQS